MSILSCPLRQAFIKLEREKEMGEVSLLFESYFVLTLAAFFV